MKKLFTAALMLFIGAQLFGQYEWNSQNTAYQESWYFYLGAGTSNITYTDDDLNEFYDWLADDYADARSTIAVDLGIYRPVSATTILGVNINGIGDRFDMGNEYFQENYYLYAVSGITYLGQFGQGLFLRADGGFTAYNYQDSDGDNETADSKGYGFLVGGGYSFNFGGTRLLLNANYCYRNYEDLDDLDFAMSSIGFTVGALF